MSYKIVESKENKLFKELLKIRKGDPKGGYFLVEGKDLVEEAYKAGMLRTLIMPLDTKAPVDFTANFPLISRFRLVWVSAISKKTRISKTVSSIWMESRIPEMPEPSSEPLYRSDIRVWSFPTTRFRYIIIR